jgi:hypothetical protein
MDTLFISRLYVPAYLKAFFFQNRELHAEYANAVKMVIMARIENYASKKDYQSFETEYSNYIEVKYPDQLKKDETNVRKKHVHLGAVFEKQVRMMLKNAFKSKLYYRVESLKMAGFKEKSAIDIFMRENNLLGLSDFTEQHCLDYYRSFRNKFTNSTKHRRV